MTVSPLHGPDATGDDVVVDPEAFAAFYRYFRPRVLVFAARCFKGCDPEDIAQETMARCYLKFEELDACRDPWPYVSTIARHAAIDARRRTARVVLTDELPEPPGAGDTTYDAVLVSERSRLVRAALAQLHPVDRQLIEDRELAGMAYADMAAVRDMTQNALRQRLFRARARLSVELRRVGASLGVVPSAVQAQLARASRKLHDVSHAAGPAGAGALSAAAVAGVATVATLLGGGPAAAPAHAARPASDGPVAAVERAARPAARPVRAEAVAPTRTGVASRRPAQAAPRPQQPPAGGPAAPDVQIPFIQRSGDPTKPNERQKYSMTVPTPVGDYRAEYDIGWLPGQGVLCWMNVTTCPEQQERPHG